MPYLIMIRLQTEMATRFVWNAMNYPYSGKFECLNLYMQQEKNEKDVLQSIFYVIVFYFTSYACDDFIVNDTNDTKLDRMRGVLTKLQAANTANDMNRSTLDGGNSSEVTVKIASDESSTGSPASIDSRRNSRSNRRSRRSRSIDSDSTGVENQPENKKIRKEKLVQKQELRNLVGLRNLGNTCFMSAVLQSLG